MTENEKGLQVIEDVSGSALEPYRDREEVRELAERLLSLHPQSTEVGREGMMAVAQLAILVGANPLPGVNELSVWKDKDGKIRFQLGVNYYRRKALEQGGLLWRDQPRQMTDKERDLYGVFPGQLAAICVGIRAEDMVKFIRLDFPANDVWDMLQSTGIGVAGVKEAKHGRPAIWTAFKRAEVDLQRQLFPTIFATVAEAQLEEGDGEGLVIIDTNGGGEEEDINDVLGLGLGSTSTAHISHPAVEEYDGDISAVTEKDKTIAALKKEAAEAKEELSIIEEVLAEEEEPEKVVVTGGGSATLTKEKLVRAQKAAEEEFEAIRAQEERVRIENGAAEVVEEEVTTIAIEPEVPPLPPKYYDWVWEQMGFNMEAPHDIRKAAIVAAFKAMGYRGVTKDEHKRIFQFEELQSLWSEDIPEGGQA